MKPTTRLTLGLSLLASPVLAQPKWTIDQRPTLEVTEYDGNPFGIIAGAATFQGGSIVVADESNTQLSIFDSRGRPLTIYGGRGGGPGEFAAVVWSGKCSPNTVAVYDPLQHRVTEVNAQGKLVALHHTDSPATILCAESGVQAIVGRSRGQVPSKIGPHRTTVDISISRAWGQPKQIGAFAGPERYRWPTTDGPRYLGKKVVVALSSTRVYVGTADSFFVQVYALDGAKLNTIYRPTQVKRLTDAAKERYIQYHIRQARNRGYKPGIEERVRRVFSGDALPDHLPAYERFVADGSTVWVEEGYTPSDSTRQWWGFDAGGSLIGKIVVPVSLHIYEISGSTVLGKWEADNGAESVRRYRLVRAAR